MSKIFIISGPSGAGEDSVIKGLKNHFSIERVITTTTRKMRPGEKQGKPYYFISLNEFKKGIKENRFFEWAEEYNNNLYGVTIKEIERVKKSKNIGIWKIEYKGVITAKKLMADVVAILINAPLEELVQRIKKRDDASRKFIKERMDYTKEWLKHKSIYDHEVFNRNGKLDLSIKKVVEIIKKNIN